VRRGGFRVRTIRLTAAQLPDVLADRRGLLFYRLESRRIGGQFFSARGAQRPRIRASPKPIRPRVWSLSESRVSGS